MKTPSLRIPNQNSSGPTRSGTRFITGLITLSALSLWPGQALSHDGHAHEDVQFAQLRPYTPADDTVRIRSGTPLQKTASTRPWPMILAANATPPGLPTSPAARNLEAVFAPFGPKVRTRSDDRFLYVESDGLPAHGMMVGITAWQQQVPLPQPYVGDNAWRIPLRPVPARLPQTIKNHFLRGAIALAVNGIPIFNPQNNRGEISQEIGELDQWGGHCGRADDYHYHAAPLHLQSIVGPGKPIAYALDGYPIYGLTEPDGSAPAKLDAFNGHETSTLGYHYHGSTKYPYVNGGFHGEVVEADGQVDPQPRAQPLREAGAPLRGAKITDFTSTGKGYSLKYEIRGGSHFVNYVQKDAGTWTFQFVAADGSKKEETYQARGDRGGGGPGRPRSREGGGGPRPRGGGPEGPRGRDPEEVQSKFGPDALKKPNASFVLSSSEVSDGGNLPMDYTGDGSGATLPLAWKGAPPGTKSYALIMDHLAPGNVMKSYWTLWDIPPDTTRLPRNVHGVGKVGTSFKGLTGYEPPHSQGPGAKTYVLTIYALAEPLEIQQSRRDVNRDVLLEAMKDKVLASSSLHVVYTRNGSSPNDSERPRPRDEGAGDNERPRPPQQVAAQDAPTADAPDGRRRRGAPPGGSEQTQNTAREPRQGPDRNGNSDRQGLIKPTMADTLKVNVYADNWFVLYINGKLTAVDSIPFTPHNVVTVDILPEYPMTIAIMAKDNADPKTGLEYGDHIGDGGFIIKFADGTVSNSKWKAKNFFKGPLHRSVKNPKVEHTPIPANWFAVEFDDSPWPTAIEYTEERVNPKQPFFEADFKGAKFIWTSDLDLDNTVIFRTKIERPGWKPRWNTRPDLDISGAPMQ